MQALPYEPSILNTPLSLRPHVPRPRPQRSPRENARDAVEGNERGEPSTMKTQGNFDEAVSAIHKRVTLSPSVALILGSGLGDFASQIENPCHIDAQEIPGYPLSTVQGHAGSLVFGGISEGGKRSPECLVFQGRVHYYESGDVSTAVVPVRLAHALGVKSILITNAAGGIDRSFRPGDLMLIDDVLTLGPLKLPSPDSSPPSRMQDIFDPEFQQIMQETARNIMVPLKQGTNAWVHGPSYETAAEIRMLRTLGAHAVGMSTVPELFEARRLEMRAVGISLISNMSTGILPLKLSHDEVTETAREASQRFSSLVRSFLVHLKTGQ